MICKSRAESQEFQSFKRSRPKDSEGLTEPDLYIPVELAQRASHLSESQPYSTPGILLNESKVSYNRTLCVRNLPEWATPEDLKHLIIRLSPAGLESLFASAIHQNHNIITNIQIARDPDTHKCLGYAFVEFLEHSVAAEILETHPGPNFVYPGTVRQLHLSWAEGPVTPSSVLDNYHFYIGNLRPGLTDRSVLNVLRNMHSAVGSVRLIPLEILGPAPEYIKDQSIPEDDIENKEGYICSLNAFYCAATQDISAETKDFLVHSEFNLEKRWTAGFIRLCDDNAFEWKAILRELRIQLASKEGDVLRRQLPVNDYHPSTAIVLRPIFGKFDSTTGTGYRYTGANFPTRNVFPKKKKTQSGGNFPQPSPFVLPSASLTETKPKYGPQHKTNIFIGNLSEDSTDEDMSLLMSPFGVVLSSRVAFLKHVAFVEFSDYRSVLAALSHLRGCTFKRNKLQLDWGRFQPLQAASIRSSNAAVLNKRQNDLPEQQEMQLADKVFARQWSQALQPQIQQCDLTVCTRGKTKLEIQKDEEKSPQEKAFWLSSLCASLPIQPSNVAET